MLQDVKDLTTPGVIKGLNTQYNLLTVQKDQSPNMMDVKVNYDGSIEKRLGSHKMNIQTITGGSASVEGFSPTTSGILTSFVSYWSLNEPSGDRIDKKGGYTMYQSGGVLYDAGKFGKAALFVASSNQFLQAPTSNAFTGNPSFSYSSWFYLYSTGGTVKRTILSKRSSPSKGSYLGDLLLHMDGAEGSTTFTDSSTSPKTISSYGGIQISTAQSVFGGAACHFIQSSGQYLATSNNTVFNFGTSDFTIDFRVRFDSIPGGQEICLYSKGDSSANDGSMNIYYYGGQIYFRVFTQAAWSWTPSLDTWYHLAFIRSSGTIFTYENGNSLGAPSRTPASSINCTDPVRIGSRLTTPYFDGYIDELRVVNNSAMWLTNFTPPASAYSGGNNGVFEYSLNVGTDNLVTFDVSSSGTAVDGTVKATSFGTVDTATWYNAVCWYDSATEKIGVVVNESFPVVESYTAGIISGSAPLCLGVENTSNYMDGRIDEVGFWTKQLGSDALAVLYNRGSGNTYGSSVDVTPWASFDFGASSIRWLTVSAGTGVYASSNLGVTWVNVATSRTANYQYLDRSKNVLIATSDSYDEPLYWAGSAGTYFAAVGTSADVPHCKYSINFQGFLILLNSSTRKRSFNYIDENYQLSSTAWLNFDFPSSADDEITACFILRRYLYVSTIYKIYRVSYVGGNPDWQYVEVKSWGFIPRTVKKIVISNQPQAGQTSSYSIGEVVVGLTWDRKLRIFDGSGDQILSNNVEKDNGMCDFALDKISYFGSGPVLSFAEIDPIPNVYRLCVSIGLDSSNTTHILNYDGRCQALYPYANMPFNTMCIAESANRQFLMAFDRDGYCHMMNSGNLDGDSTPINDFFESPLMFEKTPSQVSKGHKTDMFYTNTTSGNVYYEDRSDFSTNWKLRRKFAIGGSTQKIVHFESIDIPESYNTYQFRISSSNGTSAPWRLQRYDHFTRGLGIGRND